jgi:hypothetical protein
MELNRHPLAIEASCGRRRHLNDHRWPPNGAPSRTDLRGLPTGNLARPRLLGARLGAVVPVKVRRHARAEAARDGGAAQRDSVRAECSASLGALVVGVEVVDSR